MVLSLLASVRDSSGTWARQMTQDGPIPAAVLMVDDHPANLVALEALLEPLGLELVRAQSGAEAAGLAARREFTVISRGCAEMPEPERSRAKVGWGLVCGQRPMTSGRPFGDHRTMGHWPFLRNLPRGVIMVTILPSARADSSSWSWKIMRTRRRASLSSSWTTASTS